jgi:hypothetical protein
MNLKESMKISCSSAQSQNKWLFKTSYTVQQTTYILYILYTPQRTHLSQTSRCYVDREGCFEPLLPASLNLEFTLVLDITSKLSSAAERNGQSIKQKLQRKDNFLFQIFIAKYIFFFVSSMLLMFCMLSVSCSKYNSAISHIHGAAVFYVAHVIVTLASAVATPPAVVELELELEVPFVVDVDVDDDGTCLLSK